MNNGNRTTVAIVIAVAAMFCVTIAGAVLVLIFVPDSGATVAQLFGALAVATPAVIALAKVYEVGRKQEAIGDGVDKLRNGEMDGKLRAAVAAVLAPHLIDPAVQPQLREDRITRARVEAELRDDQQ